MASVSLKSEALAPLGYPPVDVTMRVEQLLERRAQLADDLTAIDAELGRIYARLAADRRGLIKGASTMGAEGARGARGAGVAVGMELAESRSSARSRANGRHYVN